MLGNGSHDVAEHGQVRAGDQPSLGIVEGRIEVLFLADEGRHGRAFDHGLHLALDGDQRAAHDLERDRIANAFGSCCLILRHCLPSPQPHGTPLVTCPLVCRKMPPLRTRIAKSQAWQRGDEGRRCRKKTSSAPCRPPTSRPTSSTSPPRSPRVWRAPPTASAWPSTAPRRSPRLGYRRRCSKCPGSSVFPNRASCEFWHRWSS